jgi:hypothetical protein
MKEPETWHKALSILYRPITTRKKNWFDKDKHDLYDIEPYTESHDFFIDAPAEYYLGATVFFYNLGNDLLNAMTDYSQKILKKQAKLNKTLIKNGTNFHGNSIDIIMKDGKWDELDFQWLMQQCVN